MTENGRSRPVSRDRTITCIVRKRTIMQATLAGRDEVLLQDLPLPPRGPNSRVPLLSFAPRVRALG
jgi:hypothetical protein